MAGGAGEAHLSANSYTAACHVPGEAREHRQSWICFVRIVPGPLSAPSIVIEASSRGAVGSQRHQVVQAIAAGLHLLPLARR
jgi:hypothetical protein